MKPYKSINFDLDTKELKKKYPGNSYENAYYDIRDFLECNGFEHSQGSGYVSISRLSDTAAIDVISQLMEEFPWLRGCVKKLYLSDIAYISQADMTYLTEPLDDIEQDIDVLKKEDNKKASDKEPDDTYIKPETEKPVRRRHR